MIDIKPAIYYCAIGEASEWIALPISALYHLELCVRFKMSGDIVLSFVSCIKNFIICRTSFSLFFFTVISFSEFQNEKERV